MNSNRFGNKVAHIAVSLGIMAALAGSGARCASTPPTKSVSKVDTANPVLREYDMDLIGKVKKRWIESIDKVERPESGLVRVSFQLYSDGTIQDLKVQTTNVNQFLTECCIQAVRECAPFAPWPEDMKAALKRDHRQFNFDFYY